MNVTEAELQINAILAKLEESTGCVVEDLELEKFEITTVASDRAQFQTSALIQLARLPGNSWRTK